MKQLVNILILIMLFVCFNNKQLIHCNNELIYTVNTANTKKNVFDLPDSEKNALIESCDIGEILDLNIEEKHFWVITADLFSNYLLGYGHCDPQSIQQRYNNIFEVKEKIIFDKEFDEYLRFSILYYKNSYILIYHQEGTIVVSDREVTLEDNIISAEIKTEGIILYEAIYVGMHRDEFFNKIFKKSHMYDFQNVDTFQNSTLIDGMTQNFIFQNDYLKKVVLSSDFDLVPIDSILPSRFP
jgi:hypothetical protein